MFGTFHRFSELPLELREEIWKLTIRPDRPGVHAFSIYSSKEDEDAIDEMNDARLPAAYSPDLRLAAPQLALRSVDNPSSKRNDTTASWTVNNPSTYLIDGGLWTACKESRFIMERHFCTKKWDAIRKHSFQSFRDAQRQESVPAMGCFHEKDASDHYFTVFPNKDLFYLQPYNLNTLDWGRISHDISIASMWNGFGGLKHVALEFNPNWALELEKDRPFFIELEFMTNLTDAAIDGTAWGGLDTLWFIDFGMKRKAHVPTKAETERPPRKVFYQNKCRFVEVYTGAPFDHQWEQYYKAGGDENISSRRFIQELEYAIEDGLDDRQAEHFTPTAKIGILGCEF
ncbi:hypothetical protein EDB80DRAFT_871259 [Ilyonectria destructans]|nr:hypothetical protein EDB80DRAFT_871259 [Ilyonectria destructans]